MFITLEGVEGSGKTTVASQLIELLKNEGYDVLLTREPGGNVIAEDIRRIVLTTAYETMDPRTEALLYAAARRQHLVEVVIPALNEGKMVICDRFVDSSIAYQGHARGIGVEEVAAINRFATQNCTPDLTFFLDVEPGVGLARINKDSDREVNRLDLESLDFHTSVYEGYMKLLSADVDGRFAVVDGNGTPKDIALKMMDIIKERIEHG